MIKAILQLMIKINPLN